jgi:hypothetical protein
MMATISERIILAFACAPCNVRYLFTGTTESALRDHAATQLAHALCEAR